MNCNVYHYDDQIQIFGTGHMLALIFINNTQITVSFTTFEKNKDGGIFLILKNELKDRKLKRVVRVDVIGID